jgi:hypothetical protein
MFVYYTYFFKIQLYWLSHFVSTQVFMGKDDCYIGQINVRQIL